MNPNRVVTLEVALLLDEAGLFTYEDENIIYLYENYNTSDEYKLVYNNDIPHHIAEFEYIAAPMFGEIWERLPKKMEVRLSAKDEWYGEMILILTEYEIKYEYRHDEYETVRHKIFIPNGNIADAAGRLLYQLYKAGKLNDQ